MEVKLKIIHLAGFENSNYNRASVGEEAAASEIAELISQGYSIQISHLFEDMDRRYIWVFLTRPEQPATVFGSDWVQHE